MNITVNLGDVTDLTSLADALDKAAGYLQAVANAVRTVPPIGAPGTPESTGRTTARGR